MTEEQMKAALDEKFKEVKSQLETLEKNENVSKEDYDKGILKIQDTLTKQGQELAELIEGEEVAEKGLGAQIDEWFDKNKEDILATKNGGNIMEFVPKAVHDMTTGVDTGGFDGAVPTTVNFRPRHFNLANYDYIYDLVSMFSTSEANIPYTELLPETEGYEVVAEGGKKPQISFKWVTRHVSYIKIAAHIVLTDEVIKDFKRMKSLAKEYLLKKHNIKKARNILDYAISIADVFAAGDFALQITAPNFMDIINTAAASVMLKENYVDDEEAYANVVLVNTVDYITKIVTAKDTQGRALFPNATFRNEVNLGGLLIKPHKNIALGKVFIADLSKVKVSKYEGYRVRIGWINENFIHNEFIMLGESKFHRYVEEQDKKAFLMDDITTIETAITKP